LLGLLACLLFLSPPSYGQESPNFEEISQLSPDGKFALRISYSSKPEDSNNIDPSLITAGELVSLPSKRVVMKVGQPYVNAPRLIWSKDANWFAYPLASGSRVTDTYVHHRSGDEFTQLETENLADNQTTRPRSESATKCTSMSKATSGTNMSIRFAG
jgi:hypothetical protein